MRSWVMEVLRVKPGEQHRLVLMFLYSFLAVGGVVITGNMVGRTLFLSALPKAAVPLKFLLPALATIALSPTYSRLALRFRTDRIILASTAALIAILLGFRVALASAYGSHLVTLCLLFVFFQVSIGLTMVQFWTLAGELFNPREAKRLFGLIGAGGTLAAILFGGALGGIAQYVHTPDLIYLMVACLLGSAACVAPLGQPYADLFDPPLEHEASSLLDDLNEIRQAPLLLSLTGLMVVVALVSNITSYQLDLALLTKYGSDSSSMLGFLGHLNLFTGLAAALFQFFLAGRILERFGVKTALLLLPIGMAVASGAIIASGGLFLAVMMPRAIDKVLKYTINQTALNLLYLPVPGLLRRKSRVLLGGVVNPAVISILGLVFLAIDRIPSISVSYWSVPVLILVGVWVRLLWTASAHYVDSLSESIRLRHFEPDQETIDLSDDTTAKVLIQTLDSDDPLQVIHALELMTRIPERNWQPFLVPLLSHPDETVRSLTVVSVKDPRLVAECLEDKSPSVRAAAAENLAQLLGSNALEPLAPLVDSPAPAVRGAAVLGLLRHGGLDGILLAAEHLKALLTSHTPQERQVAAQVVGQLPSQSFHQQLVVLFQDPCTQVQLTAIKAAGELAAPSLISPLLDKLDHPRTRGACVDALKRCLGQEVTLLEERLAAASTEVKIALLKIFEAQRTQAAVDLLYDQIPASRGRLRTALCQTLLRLREAGLKVKSDGLPEVLEKEILTTYQLCSYLEDEPSGELLDEAVANKVRQAYDRLLALLALIYTEIPHDAFKASLFHSDHRLKAFAVELIDNLVEGETKTQLLPLLATRRRDLPGLAREQLSLEPYSVEERLTGLVNGPSPWITVCALFSIGQRKLTSLTHLLEVHLDSEDELLSQTAGLARRLLEGQKGIDQVPLSDIEELLFLRSVPLFSELTGEELTGIVPITDEVHFDAGEVLITEGEEGDSLYILVSGEVTVTVDGQQVSTRKSRDTLGELAILSEQPRSATCTATSKVVALSLKKSDFWDLMADRSEIALGVIKVLLTYVK